MRSSILGALSLTGFGNGFSMYGEDSFFTLSVMGRVGLVIVSFAMALGWIAMTWTAARGRVLSVRLIIGLAAAVGWVWLSPQGYYQYYHLLFDGLPNQWVIRWPGFDRVMTLMTFRSEASLSAHGQGILAWALIGAAIAARHVRGSSTDPDAFD